jgi:zinc protease
LEILMMVRRVRARVAPQVLLALALSACATTLPERPIIAPHPLRQRDIQMGSGLRVVVQEDHSTPLVVVAAIYGAGAIADPRGAGGLAHLVEHLTFRSRLDGVPVADRLKRLGATFDAVTKPDTTLYYSVAHRDALPELVALEIGRMSHLLEGVSEDELGVERAIVLNERRQGFGGGTGSSVLSGVQALLFPAQHPLARPLHGSEGSLATLTLPMAQAFVRTHYVPENCTLIIAGDVDAKAIDDLMRRWPAELVVTPDGPGAPARPHRPPLVGQTAPEPPPPAQLTPLTVVGRRSTPAVVLAWSLPGLARDNEALLAMAGAGLREAADAVGAEASMLFTPAGSVVMVQAEVGRDESVEAARKRVLDEVASNRAIFRARASTTMLAWEASAYLLRNLADQVGSALFLADHLAQTGRASVYRDTMQQLVEVNRGDVADLIEKYVTRERAVTLVIEPAVAATGGRSDDEQEARPGASGEQHQLARASAGGISGMNSTDILRVARSPGLAAMPHIQLPNHLDVVAVERPGTPVALIRMLIPGGNATAEPYGLASLASSLSHTTCGLRHGDLYSVAGTMSHWHGDVSTELSVVVPEGNLANGLGVLADEVECRELGKADFSALTAAMNWREKVPASPAREVERAFWAALYPGHPYGKLGADPAAIRKVDQDAANAFVTAHYRPDAAVAVVVSAHPMAELRPLVEEFFGGWAPAPARAATVPPPAPPGPRERLVRVHDGPKTTQTFIKIACRLPPMTAETAPAYDVLERIVEEQASELRVSWGATYGLEVTVHALPGASHLTIEGSVATPKIGAAVQRLLALIQGDANPGPDGKSFIVARWDVARGFNLHLATGPGLARAFLFAARQGWSPGVWDEYPERLANTGRGDVRRLLEPCAGREVVFVYGDAAAASSQLQALGVR